jgi:hypothetical protein
MYPPLNRIAGRSEIDVEVADHRESADAKRQPDGVIGEGCLRPRSIAVVEPQGRDVDSADDRGPFSTCFQAPPVANRPPFASTSRAVTLS